MHKTFALVAVCLGLCLPSVQGQWNPDAGLFLPFSHRTGVTVSSTSGAATTGYINDHDPGTQWVSAPLLPTGFLKRTDLNAFAQQSAYQMTGSSLPNLGIITDGSLYGLEAVDAQNGQAWLSFTFPTAQSMRRLYGRFRSFTNTIDIYAHLPNGDSVLLHQLPPNTYAWQGWDIPGGVVQAITLRSADDFKINEIGGLIGALTESIVMDLGSTENISKIQSRHWSTAAEGITLYASTDSVTWQQLATLDPLDKNTQEVILSQNSMLRYIRYEYELKLLNYKKVYLWELTALDHTAPYGRMPASTPSAHSLNDMLGINAFWGWGYNRYTDGLQPGEGPEMYLPVASYARDYHNMDWDIRDPDDDISFTDMATTGGTPAQWWLNWEREYAAWINKGMPVQATIQFVDFPDTSWTTPYSSAYKYGFSFGRFFGPTYGNGQVRIVEVGNEPWKYDSVLYRTILRGMSRGLKDADSALIVLPCALQADDPSAEGTSNKNYLGARLTAAEAPYLDGINLHTYSFYKGVDGIRRAVHPEHQGSKMRGILNAMRWRDQNMPGKSIYVTEWGWDHDGAGQTCEHNECVSEAEAAAYITRGLLMMQRLGVEKATYFYHSNLWGMTLFTRSGLTGGKEVNFVKKRTFFALQSLLAETGDRQFLGVLKEDDDAWVYVLGDSTGQATHLVGWRPVVGSDSAEQVVYVETDATPIRALRLYGRDSAGMSVALPTRVGEKLEMRLSSFPTVIEIMPQSTVAYRGGSGGSTGEDAHAEKGQSMQAKATTGMLPQSTQTMSVSSLALLAEEGGEEAPLPIPQKVTTEALGLNLPERRRVRAATPLIQLGPIPARDVLTIRLENNIEPGEVYQLAVWDFQGRKHYSQVKSIQEVNHIRVDHLSPGAYKFIVFLKDGQQFAQTVRVTR